MQIKKFLAIMMLLGVVACSSQREPASAAIQNIQVTLNAAKADGERYAPEELAAVQAKVADLQANFDKKDYAAVVTAAPAVLKQARDLHSVIFSKKTAVNSAAMREWPALAASVVQWLPAVQERYEKLSEQKKLPEGVDLSAAQTALDGVGSLWTKAQQDYGAGRVETGLAGVKEIKARIEKAAAATKFTLPEVKAPIGSAPPPPPPPSTGPA